RRPDRDPPGRRDDPGQDPPALPQRRDDRQDDRLQPANGELRGEGELQRQHPAPAAEAGPDAEIDDTRATEVATRAACCFARARTAPREAASRFPVITSSSANRAWPSRRR